jgi:hypothetical protein
VYTNTQKLHVEALESGFVNNFRSVYILRAENGLTLTIQSAEQAGKSSFQAGILLYCSSLDSIPVVLTKQLTTLSPS